MTDPTDPHPDSFADLPIQPTGSGVADLEVAYEQMRLAEQAEADTTPVQTDAERAALTPTEVGDDASASEAHPS